MQAPYNDSDALFAICRTDFAAYSRKAVEVLFPGRQYNDNWHVRAMAFELMRIREGKSTRLIINVPPRHFKSTIVSVLFVAFVLGIDPTRKIMVVSYAAELAIELQNLTRELMQSDFYRRLFPATRISKSKNTETYFRTSKSGGRFAVTPGGQATGFGADLIICDDILKPEDALSETKRKKANEYLQHTLLSRLEDKKVGAMILVQQRLHPEDTTGFALQLGEWIHLKLPAIATSAEHIQIGEDDYHTRMPGDVLDSGREDCETLNKIEAQVGRDVFSAQWQQMPTPPGGRLFKLEQFRRWSKLPPLHYCQGRVISLDTAVTAAATSDYSVATIWRVCGEVYFLENVWRDKVEYPDLLKKCVELDETYAPKLFLIENSHIGLALCSTLRKADGIRFRTITSHTAKEERAATQTVKIESGRVYIPINAPWLNEFEKEISEFPESKYDDQVDSMVHFLRAMDRRIPGLNF